MARVAQTSCYTANDLARKGGALLRIIDAKEVVRIAFGMGIAMSMSSLILWKSGWLVSSIYPAYDSHGASVMVGILACLISFAWSYASPKTLRFFLERVYPLVMVGALLCTCCIDLSHFAILNFFMGLAIPVAGTYLFVFAWFFVMAAQNVESGLLGLLLAWIVTVVIRAAFELLDGEAAKSAVSLVLVCSTWVLLIVASKKVDASLPMVSSNPRESKTSYLHALRSIWKCVLYGAAFAFLGGVIRSLSLQADAMMYINYASVLGGLVSALAIAAIWRFRTIRYSINYLFRVMFPFLVLLLCALPFIGMESFVVAAAVLYVMYSFMSLSLQVLCIQTAHDFGVNPVFCISFQIGVSLCMQGLGYILGNAVNIPFLSGIPPLASIALVSLAMLALVMYFTRGISISKEEEGRDIEFLSLSRKTHPVPDGSDSFNPPEGGLSVDGAAPWNSDVKYADRLSIRCDLIGKKYYLSQREIEIMHLFARGYTMAAIAQELFISENTVKTHMRRLYAKLNIHKKQQLFNMVNSYVE